MFVVRLMVEQAEAGSIFPLAMLAHSACGDPRVHKCVARTIVRLILDYMKLAKFRNRGFLISWRGFLRFCSTTLASFQSTFFRSIICNPLLFAPRNALLSLRIGKRISIPKQIMEKWSPCICTFVLYHSGCTHIVESFPSLTLQSNNGAWLA